jgi:hypothetical protein
MTAPATDWFTLGHVANANHAADSPAWHTDTIKLAVYNDAAMTHGSPNMDSTNGYNNSPFDIGEATGTSWSAGGQTMGNITVASSSHKIVFTIPQLVVGTGVSVSSFRLGLIYRYHATLTNWGLVCLNYGADFSLATTDTLTFVWASSPIANTIFHHQ